MTFKDKNVLITGANGMIGRSLIDKMIERGANILAVDLFENKYDSKQVQFKQGDLREFSFCQLRWIFRFI